MNKVELVGRITKDLEPRNTDSTCILKFSVACDKRFKKDGDQTADFINCVAFGKTAEFIAKYFTKGQRIGLTGRIQTGSYTNKDGQKVYTTDVVAEEVEFVESKGSSSTGTTATPPTAQRPPQQMPPQNPQYQNVPQQQYQQGYQPNYNQAPPQYQQNYQPQYQQPYQQAPQQMPQQNDDFMKIPEGADEESPFI